MKAALSKSRNHHSNRYFKWVIYFKISLASTNENENPVTGLNVTNDSDSRYEDVKEILTFQNQGQTVVDDALAKTAELPQSYLQMSVANDKTHTISTFLERPIRIWSGQMTNSQTANTVIFSTQFPEALLTDPMYNEKIRGFVGLRANVEVTVQVNAQKFQQGRLRLQYVPYAKYLGTKETALATTLTTRVSSPGVDIDICGGSNPQSRIAQATLNIPYVSPQLYFNLITNEGTMGRINLFVYSPLVSATSESQNCEVTIWARFINPQLVFPTSATPAFSPTFRRHIAQVRGEAKQIKQTGVISNTLGKVAETLHTASDLPVIGQYMAIPEWIASGASSILKLFGWSKPSMPMDVKLRTTNCMSNYNGKDSSHKMALSADNEIDTPSGIGGSDLDEMALSSIFKIPSYWESFAWTTSQTTTDQILWIDPVSPYKFKDIPATDGVSALPVGFVANCFGLWRGSLIYTFKIVKTGFHAGRLRVFFVPYEQAFNLVVGSAPVNEIEKNYQVVVDIEENDTFSFKVPYVATKPWFPTTVLGQGASAIRSTTGFVVVTILNELRAVSTVSSSIEILVEISGGEDLTFACPRAPSYVPGNISAIEEEMDNNIIRKHEAQVYGTGVEIPRNEAQMLYDPNSISALDPTINWSPESHCVGEKIASARQLIKRNNYVGSIVENRTNDNNQTTTSTNNSLGVINPFGLQINTSVTNVDYISYFAYIYAFFRGGIRLKIAGLTQSADGPFIPSDVPLGKFFAKPVSTSNVFVKMFNSTDSMMSAIYNLTAKINQVLGKIGCSQLQIYGNPAANEYLHPIFADSNSALVVSNNIEGITEIEVPYYNCTHLTPALFVTNADNLFPIGDIADSEGAYPAPAIVFGTLPYNTNFLLLETVGTPDVSSTVMAATQTIYHVYRSGADDYGLYYIMGIPPLKKIATPVTNLFTPSLP